MAKLTAGARKRISPSDFAIPEKREYPIEDASHARDALSRASGKPEEARVKAAVKRKYPGISISSGPNALGRMAAMSSAKSAKSAVNAKVAQGLPNLQDYS